MSFLSRTKNKIKSNKGFTFIEVAVGMLIITVTLLTALEAVAKASIYLSDIRQNSIALQLAQGEIERLRTQSLTVTPLSNITGTSYTTTTINNLIHSMTTTLTSVSANLILVQVTVSWTGQGGRALTKTLCTNIAAKGINRL